MKLFAPVSLLLLLTGAGCATHSGELVLDRVGPAHAQANSRASEGTLVVYTALDQSLHFYGSPYHAWYSGYEVLSEDGRVVKKVMNETGTVVEGPAQVKLLQGKYRVRARSNRYGLVTVPVLIESRQMTVVHLDGGPTSDDREEVGHADAVRLPKGEIVGWRAATNAPTAALQPVATAAGH